MRLVIIMFVGIAVGVLGARLRTPGPHTVPADAPSPTRAQAGPPGMWPTLKPPTRVQQRELHASDVRYDPLILMREEDGALTAEEVFASEPRDPVFAPILEQRIHVIVEIMVQELALEGRVRAVTTECKTLSCVTRIEVAKNEGLLLYEELNGILLGDMQTPGVDDTNPDVSYVTFVNLYRPATRDEAYYQRFLEEGMRPGLEFAKQRRREATP